MSKIELNTSISDFGWSQINANFQEIEDELNDKVLYRDNPVGEPNSLDNDIDMNGNKIFNLPVPLLDSEPARLKDIKDIVAGTVSANLVPFTPTGSIASTDVQNAIVEVNTELQASVALKANIASPSLTGIPTAPQAAIDTNTTQLATCSFVLGQASNVLPVVNGIATIGTSLRYARADHIHPTDTSRAPLNSPNFTGTPQVAGDTIATLTAVQTFTNKTLTAPIIATINNAGVLTLPTGANTLVARDTTDTLTNKTLTNPTVNAATLSGNLAGTPTFTGATVTFSGLISPSSTVGIKGTVTNDSAQAGSIGEILTGTTNATSLTTGTPTNGTSVSLTAGDWDVSGVVRFNPAGTTTMAQFIIGINTVSATFNAAFQQTIVSTATFTTGNNQNLATPVVRISLSGTTTVFLVVQSTFGVSTLNCDSFIRARRVR